MPSRRTLTGLRSGPCSDLVKFTKGKVLHMDYDWIESDMKRWKWPSNECSQSRTISWAAWEEAESGGQGRRFSPSILLWWEPICTVESELVKCGVRPGTEGPEESSEGWNTSPIKKGWKSCSPWRRSSSRDFPGAFQYLKRGGLQERETFHQSL